MEGLKKWLQKFIIWGLTVAKLIYGRFQTLFRKSVKFWHFDKMFGASYFASKIAPTARIWAEVEDRSEYNNDVKLLINVPKIYYLLMFKLKWILSNTAPEYGYRKLTVFLFLFRKCICNNFYYLVSIFQLSTWLSLSFMMIIQTLNKMNSINSKMLVTRKVQAIKMVVQSLW